MQLLISVGQYVIAHAPDLAGVLIPPLIDFLNKEVNNAQEKYIVTVLVCMGFAVAFHWNQLIMGSADSTITSFLIVFAEAQTIYKLYFKNSGIRAAILDKISPTTTQPVSPQTAPTSPNDHASI